MNGKFFLLTFLTFWGMSHAEEVTAFGQKWAKVGQTLTLQCHSTEKIHGCTWVTPTGDSVHLSNGLYTDEGRIEYFDTGDDNNCGITITQVEAQDGGEWECLVGLVKGKEVTFFDSKGTVGIATKPESISLDHSFYQGNANVSGELKKQDVNCVVKNAHPEPTFNWYIGDEKLTEVEVSNKLEEDTLTWIQTLHYSPRKWHANQTLKCVVGHVALEEGDAKEAGVKLYFADNAGELYKVMLENEDIVEEAYLIQTVVFICGGVLIGVAVLVAVFVLFTKLRRRYTRKQIVEDVEKSGEKVEEKDEPEDEEDNANDDDKKEVPEKLKISLKERFASFFTFNNKKAANETLDQTEKADDDFEKVDLEKAEVEAKVDAADQADETKTDETVENERPSRIRNFFKMLTLSRTRKPDEAMDLKEQAKEIAEDEEKQVKDQKENEKKTEKLEQEDKSQIILEEEKKSGVKNTDI